MSTTDPHHEAAVAVPSAPPPARSTFGLTLPWAEPAWYNSLESPYYNASHRALRAYARQYVDTHIRPHALAWEAAGEVPRTASIAYCISGLAFLDVPLPYRPASHLAVAGIPVQSLDVFHTLLLVDETSRFEGGVSIGLSGANAIGAPPIINHGTEAQKRRWLPGLFTRATSFCLGITEPTAGSDVSRIRTTARLSPDGTHYIVSGTKKWITGAPWSTHMTTAVRTGGAGVAGISLLVVPLDAPGVTIRRIANSGQHAGGASFVTLSSVAVPRDHLLGDEGKGFYYVMSNFNRERFIMSVSCNRKARTCLATALAYAHERETFGAPLIANQLIRHKITTLAREVESHWAWLEQVAYHIGVHGWQSPDIASRIALLKVSGGRILEMAAREAQQIMGGVAYQRGGPGGGGTVEQISRDLRMMVVGGGSEEILGELAFREESKRAATMAAAKL